MMVSTGKGISHACVNVYFLVITTFYKLLILMKIHKLGAWFSELQLGYTVVMHVALRTISESSVTPFLGLLVQTYYKFSFHV